MINVTLDYDFTGFYAYVEVDESPMLLTLVKDEGDWVPRCGFKRDEQGVMRRVELPPCFTIRPDILEAVRAAE